jgi:hypothetical protein
MRTDPPLYPWMGDGYESWAESLRERERQRVNAKNQRTYHRMKGGSSPEQRAQKAAYLREWRQKNREHVNARERERYHADLDTSRAKRRAKYHAARRRTTQIVARASAQRNEPDDREPLERGSVVGFPLTTP